MAATNVFAQDKLSGTRYAMNKSGGLQKIQPSINSLRVHALTATHFLYLLDEIVGTHGIGVANQYFQYFLATRG